MKKIGITGGIGSGKSTIAKLINKLGYPVYEADVEAKKIILDDNKVRYQIIKLLGEDAYNTEGYNRQYVAKLVFNNSALLQGLNLIVHPAVEVHFNNWCARNAVDGIVFQEAAILFENNSYKKFDKTILVIAPEEMRIRRVMKRDGLRKEEVLARINKQWTDAKKRELADYIIQCDGEHLVVPQF